MKASLVVEQESQVREHKEVEVDRSNVVEQRREAHEQAANQDTRESQPKVQPAKSGKVFGRNDLVNVQYQDGKILDEVKFKKVENDVAAGKCVILEK